MRGESHAQEDEERVEGVEQDDEGAAQLADGDLAHQQQDGGSQHAPL